MSGGCSLNQRMNSAWDAAKKLQCAIDLQDHQWFTEDSVKHRNRHKFCLSENTHGEAIFVQVPRRILWVAWPCCHCSNWWETEFEQRNNWVFWDRRIWRAICDMHSIQSRDHPMESQTLHAEAGRTDRTFDELPKNCLCFKYYKWTSKKQKRT